MKRLFLILLLLVLPIQMSWSAASRYCQHEHGKAAQHFGHHEHKHQASAIEVAKESVKDSTSSKLLAVDTDCGVCQFNSAAITTKQFDPLAKYFSQMAPVFSEIDFITSLRPERPERPKWLRAI